MNLNDATTALNTRLKLELMSLAASVRSLFEAGTANVESVIAYQIVAANDNEVRFSLIATNDGAHNVVGNTTVWVICASRKARTRFILQADDTANIVTDGSATPDDVIPWILLAVTESERLATDVDLPVNVIGVGKTIVYSFDSGAELTLTVGQTVQLVHTPGLAAATPRTYRSDIPATATVTPYVDALDTGGFVTAVAPGLVRIHSSLGASIVITVVAA